MASRTETEWQNILKVVIWLGIVITVGISAKRFHSIAGPFKIVIRRIEHCPVSGDVINFTIRDVTSRDSYHLGRTYNMNATIKTPFDDTKMLRFSLGSWSNMGGWKDNAHIFSIKRACSSFSRWGSKTFTAFWMSLAGEVWPCPYPPGEYYFGNATIVLEELPFRHFFYGRWRADCQILHRNGDMAYCVRAYMDTLPR